ncbi:hypothetical protein [Nocardia wallacei]|nr:hypothetical protein [Nocardia wallacei]
MFLRILHLLDSLSGDVLLGLALMAVGIIIGILFSASMAALV